MTHKGNWSLNTLPVELVCRIFDQFDDSSLLLTCYRVVPWVVNHKKHKVFNFFSHHRFCRAVAADHFRKKNFLNRPFSPALLPKYCQNHAKIFSNLTARFFSILTLASSKTFFTKMISAKSSTRQVMSKKFFMFIHRSIAYVQSKKLINTVQNGYILER